MHPKRDRFTQALLFACAVGLFANLTYMLNRPQAAYAQGARSRQKWECTSSAIGGSTWNEYGAAGWEPYAVSGTGTPSAPYCAWFKRPR